MGLELGEAVRFLCADPVQLLRPLQRLYVLFDGEEAGSGLLGGFSGSGEFCFVGHGPIFLGIEEQYL